MGVGGVLVEVGRNVIVGKTRRMRWLVGVARQMVGSKLVVVGLVLVLMRLLVAMKPLLAVGVVTMAPWRRGSLS